MARGRLRLMLSLATPMVDMAGLMVVMEDMAGLMAAMEDMAGLMAAMEDMASLMLATDMEDMAPEAMAMESKPQYNQLISSLTKIAFLVMIEIYFTLKMTNQSKSRGQLTPVYNHAT